MFAYRNTSGSAPLYLNSLLQTYMPQEACVLQVIDALLYDGVLVPHKKKKIILRLRD